MSEEKEVVQEVTSEMVAEEFFRLVDNAAAVNLLHRQSLPDSVREQMHPVHYSFEYCTIHVDVGRAIGKTEYIRKNLAEGVVVIVPDNESRMRLLKDSKGGNGAFIVNGNGNEKVLSAELSVRKANFIFIDEPAMIKDQNLSVIYQVLSKPDMIQLFILLGK